MLDRIAPLDNRRRYAELIRVTGGEPTLHHNFADIITYLDSFGVAHVTFTNGRWRNPGKVLETFQGCRNLIGLLISLHGSTADTHCEFVESSPAAFEETCETIRRATDAGIEVFTNTVLTAESCRELESIISLSGQLGASYAVFNRYLGKPHPLEPSEELLRQTILRIEELEAGGVACRLGDCIPPCFVRNSSLGSNGGIEHCAIAPNGDVRPENLTRYVFGNLFEQPIEAIWQSEQAQWYRRQMPRTVPELL